MTTICEAQNDLFKAAAAAKRRVTDRLCEAEIHGLARDVGAEIFWGCMRAIGAQGELLTPEEDPRWETYRVNGAPWLRCQVANMFFVELDLATPEQLDEYALFAATFARALKRELVAAQRARVLVLAERTSAYEAVARVAAP